MIDTIRLFYPACDSLRAAIMARKSSLVKCSPDGEIIFDIGILC